MEFEQLVEDWASVKQFKDREVEDEKIEKLFEYVTKAPTAFNLQPYRFLIAGEKNIEKISETVVEGNEWVSGAKRIAMVLGDETIDTNSERALKDMVKRGEIEEGEVEDLRERFEEYRQRDELFRTGWLTRNTDIPATFFMLACRELGLGCCPVRGFRQEELSEVLDLEKRWRPMLIIPFGYGSSDRSWRRKPEEIYEVME